MTAPVQRLGVFGGAFDPPHRAHLALAQAAVEQLQLDQLRIFPTGQAWHKDRVLTDGAHRLAMARLAFAPVAQAVVDDAELRRPGPTYTIDTLRQLQAAHPTAQLFLLMGEDQAAAITRWHEWQAVLSIAIICIAARAHGIRACGTFESDLPPQARYRLLQLPARTDSATDIRQRLAAGKSAADLVTDGVARYIDQHHLYQAL